MDNAAAIRIKRTVIVKNHIEIDASEKQTELEISIKTSVNPAKDLENDKSALFKMQILANSKEDGVTSINIESVSRVEFDEIPKNFNGEFSEYCAKHTLEDVSEKLDAILNAMGFRGLTLYKHLNI